MSSRFKSLDQKLNSLSWSHARESCNSCIATTLEMHLAIVLVSLDVRQQPEQPAMNEFTDLTRSHHRADPSVPSVFFCKFPAMRCTLRNDSNDGTHLASDECECFGIAQARQCPSVL